VVERPAIRRDTASRTETARARVLTQLHPALASRYTALVAAVAHRVEAGLAPTVAANRLAFASVSPPVVALAPWRTERAAFATRLAAMARRAPCLVFADVRDCYATIRPEVVRASLLGLGGAAPAADGVARFLRSLRGRGVSGLPVGPGASAVLANAVLARLDGALADAHVPHLRWVDDVVAVPPDLDAAAAVLAIVRETLAAAGLELNERKTRVVPDPRSLSGTGTVSIARGRTPVG
jgi:hypothetical protein